MKYKMYKIVYNNEVIYVGYTKRELKVRFRERYSYIPKEIIKESSIELIEETYDISRERYWVTYYKDIGYNLYNIYKGDGMSIEDVKILRKIHRKKHKDNNKEYYMIYHKEYYENNKEKFDEYRKKDRENNKEKYIEYNKEYYKNNKEKWLEYNEKNKSY